MSERVSKKQAREEVDNAGGWIELRDEENNITYCTKGSDGCLALVPLLWFKFYDDDDTMRMKVKKKYRKHLIPIKPLV